jgi:phage protein D
VAQTPIPIYSQLETFYVPGFEVYVSGKKLNAAIIDDILQVTYTDSINKVDAFQIEVNNWDAESRKFKFCPPLKTSSIDYTGAFDPGSKVEIHMGYQGTLRRMLRGIITSLTPNFPESGASTLSVTGLSELHQLKTEQHTFSWEGGSKTDTEIAKYLCGLPVKKGQPGLGIKLDTNPSADEKADASVFMNNEYDIVFLLERARRKGYELYLEDEGQTPTLFFGLSQNPASVPTYRLEWGKSLLSFKPTLTTANQVGQVNVRGWDRKTNKPIDVTYTLDDLWKEQKLSKKEIAHKKQIAKAYESRTQVITDKPVHTVKEAREIAKAALLNKDARLIEATASTVGLPDLHSGCSVEILGFGVVSNEQEQTMGANSDFDGEYFVTASTHTIGSGGYRTEISARRQGPVSVNIKTDQNS